MTPPASGPATIRIGSVPDLKISSDGERRGVHATFSPDGRWIAYTSVPGPEQIEVEPFPATGARWQVSVAGGVQPRWRADGKELFYLAADRSLMAVDTVLGPGEFNAGPPRALFKTAVNLYVGMGKSYVVAADGQRFLFPQPVQESGPTPVVVVLNWAAELKR